MLLTAHAFAETAAALGAPPQMAGSKVAIADPVGLAGVVVPDDQPRAAAVPARVDLHRLAEQAALANHLPADYFVKLIGRESGFASGATSGAGAQGIAQFMPTTAHDRGLKDPFDPLEALPKSAALLSDLKAQFGNLGLAAAAYNAGPRRVQDWLEGRRHLPRETRLYVYAITGRAAEDWAPPGTHPLAGTSGDLVPPGAGKRDVHGRDSPKNWELALLLSIAAAGDGEAHSATKLQVGTTALDGKATAEARSSHSRLAGERSLCSSCIVQSFY